ncbi:MAG: integrase core domain-containing protein [Solirubrobacteraceae bacterium]
MSQAVQQQRQDDVKYLGRSKRALEANMRRNASGTAHFKPSGQPPHPGGHDECLDWLLIFSKRQLERTLHTYTDHYNRQRPHRALGLTAPDPPVS